MITAIAIDDEPPALKVIEHFCDNLEFVKLEKTFNKPNDALKFLKRFPVDLLFLDIHMPSLSGIDFYKSVLQDTMVIFTTAHAEYAVEGFNLSAVDYLLKPFTFERFSQALNRANDYYQYTHQSKLKQEKFLFVRADYSLIKINIADILYIEGLDDYLKIYVANQKRIVARMTMKVLLEKLPAQEFVRVHRSFIVPFSKIESIRGKTLLIGTQEIPIGVSFEEEFLKFFRR